MVDDVWSAAAAHAFRVAGPRGRVLYTTRDPAVLAGAGARGRTVGVLPAAAARQLLAGLTGLPGALPAEADRVLAATGRVALAVALVGAAVARRARRWAQAADELDAAGTAFLDHPYANTFKAMQVGIAALDRGLAAGLPQPGGVSRGHRIPVAAVSRLLGAPARRLTRRRSARELQTLADRELLSAGPGRGRLP